MEESNRRQFSVEQKFKIVKEVLTTDIGVTEACKKYGIVPSMYYKWQERFLEGAKVGLERKDLDKPSSKELRKIEFQEKELNRMKSVIAEITAENIDFKKNLGEF